MYPYCDSKDFSNRASLINHRNKFHKGQPLPTTHELLVSEQRDPIDFEKSIDHVQAKKRKSNDCLPVASPTKVRSTLTHTQVSSIFLSRH